MKTSVIVRVLLGTVIISYIIYCVIMGFIMWIVGDIPTNNIINIISGSIGAILLVIITCILGLGIVVLFISFIGASLTWIFTGYWNSRWFDMS